MIKLLFLLPLTLFAMEVEMGMGLRMDQLHWSISGVQNGSNVESKLEWRDIYSIQLSGRASTFLTNAFLICLEGNYAEIMGGKSFDKDYDDANQQGLYEYTRADAGDGNLYDLSASVGCRIASCLTLYSGYSYHRQALMMKDGETLFPLNQPIIGLDNSYHTLWQGPWIGLEVIGQCLRYSMKYHQVVYDADGFWNLRKDFTDKFSHDAYGFGVSGNLGYRYTLTRIAGMGFLVSGQYWRTNSGKDTTPTTDGVKIGRLNEVVWWSISGSCVVDVCF